MTSLREIIRILNAKCEEIIRLDCESMDRDLPRGQRWAIRLHYVYCTACRRCIRQIKFLRKAVRDQAGGDGHSDAAHESLDEAARARIKKTLEQS